MPTKKTKESNETSTPKRPGRPRRGEALKQTAIKVPPTLKADVKTALTMVIFLDADKAPNDFTGYVLRALREQVKRDKARFAEAGGVLPKT